MTGRAKRPHRPVRRPYPEAVAAARAFTAPLGLRDPRDIDVELLAMHAGALVVPRASARGEGHIVRAGKRALIVIREDVYALPKGVFVIGHEVGHLLCHHALDELPICTGEQRGATPGTRRIEGEASDAGSEILMPEAWFSPRLREAPSLETLLALAAWFRVPLEAAALRALLFVPEPCALVVAEAGRVAWWACSEGWEVTVHRKAPVHEATCAACVGSGGRREISGRVRGAVWGDETRGPIELVEHALAVPGAGADGAEAVVVWLVQGRGEAARSRA